MKIPPSLRWIVALLVLGFASIARADNLTLVGTDGTNAGGQYVYPYYFSVNGSSDLMKLLCLSLDRVVTMNESWEATPGFIPLGNDDYSVALRADAYILSQAGQYSTVDLQYAVWSILDPKDAMSNSAWTSTAADLAQKAMDKARDNAFTASGFYSQYMIFTPTSNQTGWTAGEPQVMMGLTSDYTPLGPGPLAPPQADTPEPNSLVLMATGLAAAGMLVVYRRRRPAAALVA